MPQHKHITNRSLHLIVTTSLLEGETQLWLQKEGATSLRIFSRANRECSAVLFAARGKIEFAGDKCFCICISNNSCFLLT